MHVATELKRKIKTNKRLLRYKHWTKGILAITLDVEYYNKDALLTVAHIGPPHYYNSIKKKKQPGIPYKILLKVNTEVK